MEVSGIYSVAWLYEENLTFPVSLRKRGIAIWILNNKEPGTHEIGKVGMGCILQPSLSCIIPSISYPLLLLMIIIIISSKLVSGVMELEDFIIYFLDPFRN